MEEQKIERSIDDIPAVTPKPAFDASQYEGKRVKIAEVSEIEAIDYFTGEGNVYNPNSTKKVHQIKIVTEPLHLIKEDGTFADELYTYMDELSSQTKNIKVSETFNLKEDNGKWYISKHPKAKLWKFMRKMGVEKLSDLKDKYVTLLTVPSNNPDDDRVYLRIAV